jgi:hypothetical protein
MTRKKKKEKEKNKNGGRIFFERRQDANRSGKNIA